jgi:predicted nucleotidyltransferase
MAVAGIIGEYNPFHNGHCYQISATRAALGRDTRIVCVLSGTFVQRGDVAVFDKFARAEMAICGGADLVLELPVPWSLASAESFARGAVGILGQIGVVTHLSFGSEAGELSGLEQIAHHLSQVAFEQRLRAREELGISYAAAREKLLAAELGELSELVRRPNNILAIEYLKAIRNQSLDLIPLTIPRQGAEHDGTEGTAEYKSASQLRMMLKEGSSLQNSVPVATGKIIEREKALGRGPLAMEMLEQGLLARLRMLPPEIFEKLPGATEGLGNRLYKAIHSSASYEEILMKTKSKRYALSRIRRLVLCGALGIEKEADTATPPYARVLAFNRDGQLLLRAMKEKSTIPILTKPAAVREWGENCLRVFHKESDAVDFWALGCRQMEDRRCGKDWTRGPVILALN